MDSSSGFRKFLKDIGLRIIGAVGGIGLLFLLAVAGDRFDIGFLQSQGVLLVSVIVLGEFIFFSLLVWAVIRGDF
jgi:hypothetical protein